VADNSAKKYGNNFNRGFVVETN